MRNDRTVGGNEKETQKTALLKRFFSAGLFNHVIFPSFAGRTRNRLISRAAMYSTIVTYSTF